MIFGTLQHCIVLNSGVNSIFNKFIRQVLPPGDKNSNPVFLLSISSEAHCNQMSTSVNFLLPGGYQKWISCTSLYHFEVFFLLQSAFERMSPFATSTASCPQDFLPRLAASIKNNVGCCSSRSSLNTLL